MLKSILKTDFKDQANESTTNFINFLLMLLTTISVEQSSAQFTPFQKVLKINDLKLPTVVNGIATFDLFRKL